MVEGDRLGLGLLRQFSEREGVLRARHGIDIVLVDVLQKGEKKPKMRAVYSSGLFSSIAAAAEPGASASMKGAGGWD